MGLKEQLAYLSTREMEVVNRILNGEQMDEICEMMHISKRTVEWFKRRIRFKLGITGIGTTEKALRRMYSDAGYEDWKS